MKGATADPWAKISSTAKSTITINIGMSHHSLRFQRKENSSPNIPKRVDKPLWDPSDTFDLPNNLTVTIADQAMKFV
jgi:hypothetical protein